MKITQCKAQRPKTLIEFYSEISNSKDLVSAEIGKTMIDLIHRLESIKDDRQVWGLTSHFNLLLLSQNNVQTPRYVDIIALDKSNYFIKYLLPSELSPWPNAYVTGEARTEYEAIKMIFEAMKRSKGWE